MLQGCAELAKEIFELPVAIGKPRGITGRANAVGEPLYATAVGLVQFGLFHQNGNFISDGGDFFDSIFGRMKHWVQNFF